MPKFTYKVVVPKLEKFCERSFEQAIKQKELVLKVKNLNYMKGLSKISEFAVKELQTTVRAKNRNHIDTQD